MNHIKEIESIIFGILSAKEIADMSVCKIDNTKLSGPNSVYDERMGCNIENNTPCVTCGLSPKKCPGHFGHIELSEYIIHPLFYKYVVSFLRCFCTHCNRLLITGDQLAICGLNRFKSEKRFAKILEKLEKVYLCTYCDSPQPKIVYTIADNSITMVYRENLNSEEDLKKKENKISVPLTVEEIKKSFDSFTDEDVILCGFDPARMHPRNLIMSNFPVIPPCARPFVMADGNICDDDLTNQILEIIKANNILKGMENEKEDDSKVAAKKQKTIQSLKFRIATFYNNSQGKAKHPTNGRPIKGLKERITGKEGQLRNNLMGKRCISPDTQVMMFNDGKSKRADEIVVGDIIVGDDGFPRNVIDTITGQGVLYRVSQSYGDSYIINSAHVLTLKYYNHGKIYWANSIGKFGSWAMKWYDRETKSVKEAIFSVSEYTTREKAEDEIKEFIKQKKLSSRVKYIWSSESEEYILNYKNVNKRISTRGKTKEEALTDINKLRATININPVIDIDIQDYLKLSVIDRNHMMGIKLDTPVKWPVKKIDLDPRILGMWLGDVESINTKFTGKDEHVVSYCSEWIDSKSKKFTVNTFCNNIHYNSEMYHNFPEKLHSYNLLVFKYVPENYIVNDDYIRLLLLSGLIDVYGYVNENGTIIRLRWNESYAIVVDGVVRLAKSLGFKATVDKIKVACLRTFRFFLQITISGKGLERIPVLSPHKKCRSSIYDLLSYKIEVERIGDGKFCGITVDKNNRFLLGDYTITHNCDYSGRTVIGPEPNLPFGWMAIPKEVSKELTKPEMVCVFNKDYLEKLVNEEKANFIVKSNKTKINLKYAMFSQGTPLLKGDIVIRGDKRIEVNNNNIILTSEDKVEREGKLMEGVKIGDVVIRENERIKVTRKNFPLRFGDQVERDGKIINKKRILTFTTKKYIKLELGDEVHRHLKDGDLVLLNRQPTLHKGSMLAMRVRVCSGKTFRMNLATCRTFNADFDGDEMNIHVPQSVESVAELQELSAAKHNMISAQGSKPNITIVQDSLTAAFLMSNENKPITKEQFFDISMCGNRNGKSLYSPEKIKTILQVLKEKGKKQEVWNGRGLLSLLFPEDFIYEKKNDASSTEPVVRIYRGVFYEGVLDKNILGASFNSLIQVLNKEYGIEVTSDFISNIQFITNKWLLINGFSIGLQDCLINDPDSINKIQDKISMCYIEAGCIEESTHNPNIREIRVAAALSKAKDVGMKIAKDAMSKSNNLLSTVYAGSKGDFFNIAQLTGLLGQQNLVGKRVTPTLNHGKRTLPHYEFGKMDNIEEYESRGFVRHSFIEGLNPQEFFFHAMSGREGICDTAMGTAKSGYIQRRIIKVCEDISIKYDGSVRDTTGKIYQMAYGDNGLDPCATVKVGDKQQACDISRIVDRLNLQFEIAGEK